MNNPLPTTLTINGNTYMLVGTDGAPGPIDDSLYDEDGWGIPDEHGCVRIKTVDEHLNIMAVGDEFQREAAANAATKFAVILPHVAYDQATLVNLRRNYQAHGGLSFSGWQFPDFHAVVDRNTDGTLTPVGLPLDGYTTPVNGFNLNVIHQTLTEKAVWNLNRQAEVLRFRAENPNQPEPIARG